MIGVVAFDYLLRLSSSCLIARGNGRRIHPYGLPYVAVGICQIAVIHKPKILHWINVGCPAVPGSGLVHGIHRLATVTRQGKHHFT